MIFNVIYMKICVPMKSSMVHNHFGKAPEFMLLTVEERKVTSKEVVKNPGREKGAILELMPALGVTVTPALAMERARNLATMLLARFNVSAKVVS